MKRKGNYKGLYITSNVPLEKLDEIVTQLPKQFGAYVDHRVKRDTWIIVKSEYQQEARNYIINELGYRVVRTDISDKWLYLRFAWDI